MLSGQALKGYNLYNLCVCRVLTIQASLVSCLTTMMSQMTEPLFKKILDEKLLEVGQQLEDFLSILISVLLECATYLPPDWIVLLTDINASVHLHTAHAE